MKYNKAKHLDLLKYRQKLESEGKSLYEESNKDFLELRHYSAMMIAHLHWQNREQYFSLIQKFLDNPLDLLPLQTLRERYDSINDAVKRLQAELILLDPIEPYDKAFEFTGSIDKISGVFHKYILEQGPDECMDKEEVKNLVQTIFVEMKEH